MPWVASATVPARPVRARREIAGQRAAPVRCEWLLAGRKHSRCVSEPARLHASDMPEVATHCPYCALQCGMTLRADASGRVEVAPRDFPTNRGGLCQKGWTAADLLDHPDRLTTPLISGRPASSTAALDLLAGRIRDRQERHGGGAVAAFGGGGPPHAQAYDLGKFGPRTPPTPPLHYYGP